jgi:hypothetical protein
VVVVHKILEPAYDPEVPKARLVIPVNQDVALGIQTVNMRGHPFLHFAYRRDATM